MTIYVRAVTTPSVDTSSPYTTNKPTGTTTGDFLLAVPVAVSEAIDQVSPPSDWYAVRGAGINGTDNVCAWYKVAGSSEPSSYDFTSGSNTPVGVGILALYSDSGVINIDGVPVTQVNASGNRAFPSVTLSAAGMAVCIGAVGNNFTSTPPGGMSEQWDVGLSANRTYCMTGTFSAGATGTITATGTSSDSKCITIGLVEAITTYPGIRYKSRASTGPSTVTSSIGLAMPSDIAAGMALVAHLTLAADRTVTALDGWTLQANLATTGAMRVWTRIADGTEASATLTVNFTGGSVAASLAVSAFWSPSGDDLTIGQVATSSNASASSHVFPSVTSTQSGSVLVMLASKANTTQWQCTNNRDMWERYDFGASSVRAGMFSEYLLTIGATGTRTIEPTSGSSAADMASLLIEVYIAPPIDRIYPSEGYYTVVYDNHDVTGYCRVADLLGVTAQLDATSLADDAPVEEPGATTWRVTLEGLLTKQIDDWLGIDALRPPATFRDLTITMGETGNATTYTWEGDTAVGAFVENYRVGPSVQFGEIPFRAELGTSGAPTRGTA